MYRFKPLPKTAGTDHVNIASCPIVDKQRRLFRFQISQAKYCNVFIRKILEQKLDFPGG
jgi:hypothetical protein